jgi:hypothetical protein
MAALLSHRLAKESDMAQREMIDFIREEFGEEVSATTIFRTLKKRNTTSKVMRHVAQQQVPDRSIYAEGREAIPLFQWINGQASI